MVAPSASLRTYRDDQFHNYRLRDQRQQLSKFPKPIESAVNRGDWGVVRRYLQQHRSEQEQVTQNEIGSERGRSIQSLGATALRSNTVH
jgi:hypothetical protein